MALFTNMVIAKYMIFLQYTDIPQFSVILVSSFPLINWITKYVYRVVSYSRYRRQLQHKNRTTQKICIYHLNPRRFFSFSFFLTTSTFLSLQLLFLSFIGLLPTYLPEKVKTIAMLCCQQVAKPGRYMCNFIHHSPQSFIKFLIFVNYLKHSY